MGHVANNILTCCTCPDGDTKYNHPCACPIISVTFNTVEKSGSLCGHDAFKGGPNNVPPPIPNVLYRKRVRRVVSDKVGKLKYYTVCRSPWSCECLATYVDQGDGFICLCDDGDTDWVSCTRTFTLIENDAPEGTDGLEWEGLVTFEETQQYTITEQGQCLGPVFTYKDPDPYPEHAPDTECPEGTEYSWNLISNTVSHLTYIPSPRPLGGTVVSNTLISDTTILKMVRSYEGSEEVSAMKTSCVAPTTYTYTTIPAPENSESEETTVETIELSEPDTESDLLARLEGMDGTIRTEVTPDSIFPHSSIWQAITTGKKVTKRTSAYVIRVDKIRPGIVYNACVRIERRRSYSGDPPPDIPSEELSFHEVEPTIIEGITIESGEPGDLHDQRILDPVELPHIKGWEYRVKGVQIWPNYTQCECVTDYEEPAE